MSLFRLPMAFMFRVRKILSADHLHGSEHRQGKRPACLLQPIHLILPSLGKS